MNKEPYNRRHDWNISDLNIIKSGSDEDTQQTCSSGTFILIYFNDLTLLLAHFTPYSIFSETDKRDFANKTVLCKQPLRNPCLLINNLLHNHNLHEKE